MFDKILIALGLAIILYVAWILISSSYPTLFESKKDSFLSPSIAPPIEYEVPIEPTRTVSPAGPASPNAAPHISEEATLPPEVNGTDPYADDNSSSHMTDNLRHPERLFSAGVRNTDSSLSQASGVGSPDTQVTAQALQTFAPENAMNGGFFMGGVSANDTVSNSEFASF